MVYIIKTPKPFMYEKIISIPHHLFKKLNYTFSLFQEKKNLCKKKLGGEKKWKMKENTTASHIREGKRLKET